ncbi:MAG: hypothetical protein JW800_00725 [Candidatus Omnitrophica bacterium]|nr:hypothetical protein [Candidatus Omnitrophota bacterium]
MALTNLTSLDLYLRFPPEEVIETKCLEDVGCGIYPCYYTKKGNSLKVSTSVTSLVFDSGRFDLNPRFKPPDFLDPAYIASHGDEWYDTNDTADKRIRKLKPFEKITVKQVGLFSFASSSNTFAPEFSILDKEEIIDKSAYHIRKFMNGVEEKFPGYDHIVFTGGRDSQIMSLVPKLDSERWHVYSAEPNFPLVKKWLQDNEVPFNKLFTHNNVNDETEEDFKGKIICGDLYTDPRHNKWLPHIKNIAKQFKYKCIFWSGIQTIPPAHFYLGTWFGHDFKEPSEFYSYHFKMTASWQGNTMQIFKNFVRCPSDLSLSLQRDMGGALQVLQSTCA